ncbi:BETA-14-MANNOSYL-GLYCOPROTEIN BETA-14-N-ACETYLGLUCOSAMINYL-TRANSFERASE [Salix purpurea]|uniref:BETA-14-MANNOSYL-GLYCOPROTEIN BETA-14-N-ACETYLGLUCOSAMINYL-TRANSFERASE n=1 Tax=Salix purpurea TaxID=77065 RepID=A0A9Q0VT72_SALPP|nr:BETA-14-MANNOSYL-GLYCOPROTEIN BETA-14-N-ACETYLGLUCOSAMINYL-TRANSFERASE [Salix purpurea]
MSIGYYSSKKTDDICEEVCGQSSRAALSMSRLKCILRGLDLKTYIILLVLVPLGILGMYLHGPKISSFLRPIWDSPPKPFQIIPHYYHHNVSMENLCRLNGWGGVRESPRRVYDAVLFNNEVDILTIRWKELYPYITRFVILEANSTFTGIPKPLLFARNRDRFKFHREPADLWDGWREVQERGKPICRRSISEGSTGPAH